MEEAGWKEERRAWGKGVESRGDAETGAAGRKEGVD